MRTLRLNQYLALCGIASRRDADNLIQKGFVSINSHICRTLGTKVSPWKDRVYYKGKKLSLPPKYSYLMLYKPRGVICTRKDPQNRKTVFSFIKRQYKSLFYVGRLDLNSEGLLLFTNNGELASKLLHPSSRVSKTYFIKVNGFVKDAHIDLLLKGIALDEGIAFARSINIVKRKEDISSLYMSITQGMKRQIRRMFEQLGLPVLLLRRETFASLKLQNVSKGRYRLLLDKEINALLKDVKL